MKPDNYLSDRIIYETIDEMFKKIEKDEKERFRKAEDERDESALESKN